MEKEVYRVPEFCKRYAISRTSLYKEVNESRLRLIKRGRRTLVFGLFRSIMLRRSFRPNAPACRTKNPVTAHPTP